MSVLSQGTQIYAIDPADDSLITVECATSFSPGGSPSDQIEVTCMEAFERSFMPGLRTPGQATIGLNADPSKPTHVRLFELSQENPQPVLKWAVGWSDGTDAPTVLAAEFVLPTTRTFFTFQGYVSDFPFDFAQNTVVTSTVTVQRSGGSTWIPKV